MPEKQTPPSQRRRCRRREIYIEEPQLRRMSESERQAADAALTRLIALMLANEEFMKAETLRQRNVNTDYGV